MNNNPPPRHTHNSIYLHCHHSTFSNGRAGSSFFMLQADFLQRYQDIGQLAATFIHGSIGPLGTGRKTGTHGPDRHTQTGRKQTYGHGTETGRGKGAGQKGQMGGCKRSSQLHLHLSQFVQFDVGLQFPKTNF